MDASLISLYDSYFSNLKKHRKRWREFVTSFPLPEIAGLIALIIVGIIIIFIIRFILILIPAAIIAFLVWFFTGSTWYAGIAFLVIAAISIVKKL